MIFDIWKLAAQLVAYRRELTHQLQQCFDLNHPYNVATLKSRLEIVEQLIEAIKPDIYGML